MATSNMFKLFSVFILYVGVNGRIHDLTLEMDGRREISLSTFGFLQDGILDVNVTMFSFKKIPFHPSQDFTGVNIDGQFGFTLSKRDNTGGNTYLSNIEKTCTLKPDMMFGDDDENKNTINVILLTLDFTNSEVIVQRFGDDVKNLEIQKPPAVAVAVAEPHEAHKRSAPELHEMLSDSYLYVPVHRRRKRAVLEKNAENQKNTVLIANEDKKGSAPEEETESPTNAKNNGSETESPTNAKNTGSETESITNAKNAGSAEKNKIDSKGSTDNKNNIESTDKANEPKVNLQQKIPIIRKPKTNGIYSFQFRLKVNHEKEEGLYHLYFHNCLGASKGTLKQFGAEVNLSIKITENNNGNFLSAGNMPLPTLYFVFCCVFFVMGGVWLAVLRRAREDVYKIHFLMLTVVYLKCLSLLFHAVHFHFIEVKGTQEEAWAVLYYIAYLMKVTLLFLTILLIGAGWAFVKHLLSEKEKKLFIIFIPLQILANVAFIIVEESEQGMAVYTTWKEIFVLVDLLCCGAILFPVVWSIRHLTEASHTDGKAAINLSKLKLFRQFYILVVCYIYFTRIIVYLLQITVPFKYSWLDELFKQAAVVIFFVVTGVKFRPASDNPYLQVPQDSDDEMEMDEVLTKSAALTTVVKVNRGSAERETTIANKRESSHEYD